MSCKLCLPIYFFHLLVISNLKPLSLSSGLNVESSKWENLTSIDKVDRSNEVCVMCWQNQHDEDTILYGTRGGMVKSYSTLTHTDTDVLQVTDGDEQILKGLFKLDK